MGYLLDTSTLVEVLRASPSPKLVRRMSSVPSRERFGEDWYRNPRFAEALCEADLAPAPPGPIEPAALEAGLAALAQAFGQVL